MSQKIRTLMEHGKAIESYSGLRKVNGLVWRLVPLHSTGLQKKALTGDPTAHFTKQGIPIINKEVTGDDRASQGAIM